MKKYSLLAISLLFACMANAQLFNIAGVDVGYLYVGPKLGSNASFNSIDANAGSEKTANYGYQFGGIAKFGITEKLAIQPELIFSSKGVSQESGTFRTDANTKYFGIPVIAKYAFAAISGIGIYGAGGFYTDYLTGMEIVFKNDGVNEYDEKVTDLSPYNRFDFGLNFGGGATIPFKNNDQLNIDLRFGFGLTNVEKDNTASSSRNTSVQLSAVYLVDLTKWVHFRGNSTKKSGNQEQNSAPAGNSKVDRTNE